MSYPSMSDYREALQNPRFAFKVSDLQNADIKKSPLGLPLLVSGGFALTACLTVHPSRKFAVRCFHKEVSDLQVRYEYISNFLRTCTEDFFVKFEYEPYGIKVHGRWFPIVKMDWVDGVSLPEYIDDNISKPHKLKELVEELRIIATKLNKLKVAHGDLQHGNIMVRPNGKPVLIDYDGTYVYGMPFKNSNETGHSSYQHPQRNGSFFNEKIDCFSFCVIYLSLLSLTSSQGINLWKKYRDSEKLLFSRDDYKSPHNSQIFSDLINHPDVHISQLTKRLQVLCSSPIDSLPSLEEFLNFNYSLSFNSYNPINIPLPSVTQPVIMQGQYETIDAKNVKGLIKQEGNKVAIVGRVLNVATITISNGKKMIFINFGDPWDKEYLNNKKYNQFNIVVFEEGLNVWNKAKSQKIESLEGLEIKIVGLIELYTKKSLQHGDSITPQIILSDPYQLEITTKKIDESSFHNFNSNSPIHTITSGNLSSKNTQLPPKPKPPLTSTTSSLSGSSTFPPNIPPKPAPPKTQNKSATSGSLSSNSQNSVKSNTSQTAQSHIPSTKAGNLQTPENNKKEEQINKLLRIGIGTTIGIIAGSAVGGPFGAVIGAAAGAALGAWVKSFGKTKK
jgi:hypothetical protein